MSTILIAIVVLCVLAFVLIYKQNSSAPKLGVRDGQLMPLSSKPNCVSSQTTLKEKFVAPLHFKDSSEATITALKAAVAAYGPHEIMDETANYLYVIFTTPLMKYRDDVEFYLDETTQKVHFRSSSRAGYSDMGLNKKRYHALAASYQDA